MAATFIRPDMLALASELGCLPKIDKPNLVEIPAMLWKHYRDIAIRERSSVRAVILDVLRQHLGEV